MDDIAAVYETGVTKIWLSQWNNVQSLADPFDATFNTTSSLIPAANVPTVPGTNGPWDLAGRAVRIKIADIDGTRLSRHRKDQRGRCERRYGLCDHHQSGPIPLPTPQNPTFEYGGMIGPTAKVTGSMANLVNVDNKWENLTEVYQNSSVQTLTPSSTTAADNTLQTLSNLQQDDGLTYNVAKTQKLSIVVSNPDASFNGLPITSVTLRTKYAVGASYTNANFIEWSVDGITYFPTTIKPAEQPDERHPHL